MVFVSLSLDGLLVLVGNNHDRTELLDQERRNTGTAWTRDDYFEKHGYLVIKNLWNPEELYREVPSIRGQVNYWGKGLDQYNFIENEMQVEGSLATYTHPQYTNSF